MVLDQIAARGIKNPAVLKAMRETPREQFMPPGVRAFTAPLSSMEVDAKN
jgi:protein-L-isoaspartate O-methyltransferase